MTDLYHHNALPPGSTVDEYRLIEVLGEGGFGIVYKGEGRYLGDQVAIKEYLPRHLATRTAGTTVAPTSSDSEEAYSWGLKKFQEEARILWNLAQPDRHPNIVAVRRFFEANGTTYMVMDFEEARPLSDLLKGKRTLPQDLLEVALHRLLNGLERVHAAGIWHRDIKPANILIRADGSPVLLDFGAARQELNSQTRSIVAAITPPYAAFEQYAARGNDGPWTDIYAMGVTLFRCITGRLPPDAAERVDEDQMIPLSKQDLPGYTPAFLAAVDRALAVRAKDRPQSVSEWRGYFDGLGDENANALSSGGDTTVLRTLAPASGEPERASAERASVPLLGERERIAGSEQEHASSNRKLALIGAAIAVVVAGAFGATMIDVDRLFGDPDADAWQEARQIGDVSAINDYIRSFPDGRYVVEAKSLLTDIEQTAQSSQAATDSAETAAKAATLKGEADEAAWSQAKSGNTAQSYEAYLSAQPDGQYVSEAHSRRDELQREQLGWEQAGDADSLAGYQTYLDSFPAGAHKQDAQSRIAKLTEEAQRTADTRAKAEAEAKAAALSQELAAKEKLAEEEQSWAEAETGNTIEAFQSYLDANPTGPHVAEATGRIAALQQQAELQAQEQAQEADELAWAQASADDSVAAYNGYLQQYSEGIHTQDAQVRLDELQKPVVTETTGQYVARNNANIRNAPARDSVVLGSLSEGNEVAVTAKVAVAGETWMRIERDGKEAFVFGSLLKEVPEEEILAWNELRRLLDDTPGEDLSPGAKATAIAGFVDSFPGSHHLEEAGAERTAFQAQQIRIEAESTLQADIAKEAWTKVADSKNPDDYRRYIKNYPQSEFSRQAESSLESLAAEEAAQAKAAEEARIEAVRKAVEAEIVAESQKRADEAEKTAKAEEQATAAQTAAIAFPEPSISRDEMQEFFEDKEYVLRQIVTDYNGENRIHIRGAAADPRATRIFSVLVRSALPPSVGDGRYVDVNFAVKDGRNEIFRPFRFGILWNNGEPEIISHSRLK